ncbi:Imm48 family immunity protein [Bacillus proteolyticus]|uniref:Imm48 family immunity protein n=1 Tax=Bacillus proteolyticus TaxID=2026192 RepID=UPI002E2177DB|nr:Imm48 family immunity protein [Bacillus proteolyticus]
MNEKESFFQQSVDLFDIVLNGTKIDFDNEQDKQVLGAYLFGILNGLGREKNISPTDIQATMIQILSKKLNYTLESAVQFSQYLINSTDKSFHPTIFAIIHRGLEEYYLFKDQNIKSLLEDFESILKTIKSEG